MANIEYGSSNHDWKSSSMIAADIPESDQGIAAFKERLGSWPKRHNFLNSSLVLNGLVSADLLRMDLEAKSKLLGGDSPGRIDKEEAILLGIVSLPLIGIGLHRLNQRRLMKQESMQRINRRFDMVNLNNELEQLNRQRQKAADTGDTASVEAINNQIREANKRKLPKR